MNRLLVALVPAALVVGFALAPEKKVVSATAVIHPTKGQTVAGVVKFEQTDAGCKVTWALTGLAPGLHGMHVHELGDCNCDDGKCTGGHFNPEGKKHGGPAGPERHVGDLGNVKADDKGNATGEMVDPQISLSGAHSIIGRAVVVHEKEDDLKTDPTGNAGGRFGIGVVGISKEQ
jgi:Cu-Zn family superoxide dismutase